MVRSPPAGRPAWVPVSTVRGTRSFEILAAKRGDGTGCTIVRPARATDPAAARAALSRLAEAHRSIRHPRVPVCVAEGVEGGRPFVALDVPAVADAVELVRLLAASSRRVPYPAADAFILGLREAADAAHGTRVAGLGGPFCLGRWSYGNVLFDADGRWYVLGFGHNVACLDEHGGVDGSIATFHAPEIAAGAPPSPEGDLVGLTLMMRSVLPLVSVPRMLADLMAGRQRPRLAGLAELLRLFERRVMAELPGARASTREAVEISSRIRAALGVTPDPEEFSRLVAAVLREAGIPPPSTAVEVTVAASASWVLAEGRRRRLGGPQRRLLSALLAAHRGDPERPLTAWELFDAGWPGERVAPEAAMNRLYVALARLRAAGLRGAVERFDGGWRLGPRVIVDDGS